MAFPTIYHSAAGWYSERVHSDAVVIARAELLRRQARERGLSLPTFGSSMLPSLPSGTEVRVEVDRRPSFGDVVAFVAADGDIVIHRWVGAFRGRHVALGDNRRTFDRPFTADQLIGVIDRDRVIVRHVLGVVAAASRHLRARLRR